MRERESPWPRASRDRESARECECVCVRERVCVCVCERERVTMAASSKSKSMSPCTCGRNRMNERMPRARLLSDAISAGLTMPRHPLWATLSTVLSSSSHGRGRHPNPTMLERKRPGLAELTRSNQTVTEPADVPACFSETQEPFANKTTAYLMRLPAAPFWNPRASWGLIANALCSAETKTLRSLKGVPTPSRSPVFKRGIEKNNGNRTLSSVPFTCRALLLWELKLPWREAGPPNHHDDKADSDQ